MTSAPSTGTPQTLEGVIEAVLTGALAPREATTEDDFHATWIAMGLARTEPTLMAAVGGALADRLAWVFLSGYQAVLRRGLSDLPVEDGWMALANTEGVGDLPGTSLTGEPGQRRLNGWKTWLAAADHVERLVVSARQNERPLIVIRRDQPGVTIEHSRSGGYLGEMIQGRVRFDDVTVLEEQIVNDERVFSTFRAGEGAYVRVALSAFILSHAVRLHAPAELITSAVGALVAAAGAVALPLPSRSATIAIGGVDAQTRALATEFGTFIAQADPALHELSERDARLFRSDALSRRAEEALAALGLVLRQPSSA